MRNRGPPGVRRRRRVHAWRARAASCGVGNGIRGHAADCQALQPAVAHVLLGFFANALYLSHLRRRRAQQRPTEDGSPPASRPAVSSRAAGVFCLAAILITGVAIWFEQGQVLYGLRKGLSRTIVEAKESKERI